MSAAATSGGRPNWNCNRLQEHEMRRGTTRLRVASKGVGGSPAQNSSPPAAAGVRCLVSGSRKRALLRAENARGQGVQPRPLYKIRPQTRGLYVDKLRMKLDERRKVRAIAR